MPPRMIPPSRADEALPKRSSYVNVTPNRSEPNLPGRDELQELLRLFVMDVKPFASTELARVQDATAGLAVLRSDRVVEHLVVQDAFHDVGRDPRMVEDPVEDDRLMRVVVVAPDRAASSAAPADRDGGQKRREVLAV